MRAIITALVVIAVGITTVVVITGMEMVAGITIPNVNQIPLLSMMTWNFNRPGGGVYLPIY
jgi:hypothetical protein